MNAIAFQRNSHCTLSRRFITTKCIPIDVLPISILEFNNAISFFHRKTTTKSRKHENVAFSYVYLQSAACDAYFTFQWRLRLTGEQFMETMYEIHIHGVFHNALHFIYCLICH